MASFRYPGPVGHANQPVNIDDGTLVRAYSAPPGSLGVNDWADFRFTSQLVDFLGVNDQKQLGLRPRNHWEQTALNAIGFDDSWDIKAILKRNTRITAAYGKMFKRKPQVYVWCGLAAFASHSAGRAMNAQNSALGHASAATAVAPVASYILKIPDGATLIKRALLMLGQGNLIIYKDMMWQHEAYDFGGIEEMRERRNSGELDEQLLKAWEDVHRGEKTNNKDLIFRGAAAMAKYEQEVILQDVIAGSEALFNTLGGLAISPIPGDNVSFRKHLPNGSFGNGRDRASYAVEYLVPRWQHELTNNGDQVMVLINDLILRGR